MRRASRGRADILDGLKLIVLAQSIVLLASAPAWAAPVSVSIEGGVEVKTSLEGVDASTLLSPDAAKAAVESKLSSISACFEQSTEKVDASYSVQMDIDASGKVTGLRAVGSSL